MDEPLDDAKIEQLRAWAVRLAADGDDERRAAGKAIRLLIAEIERSRVAVAPPEAEPETKPPAPAHEPDEPSVERTLRSRLSRIRARSSA